MENAVEKEAHRPLTDAEVMLEVEKVKELPNIAGRTDAVKKWDDALLGSVMLLLEKRHSTRTDDGLAFVGILKEDYYHRAKAHGEAITASFAKEEDAALKAYWTRGGKLPQFLITIELAVRLITDRADGEWEPLERIVLEMLETPQSKPAILEASRSASALERYERAGGR